MMKRHLLLAMLLSVVAQFGASAASAHHVLGRPAYSLNEDSNTPPAVQGETEIGGFIVTYMVFPAFPRPREPGRVNFYIKSEQDGTPYQGKVTFTIRDDSWLSRVRFGESMAVLGAQRPDDGVFRQGFVFPDEGQYIISASFKADGQSHTIDFPLRIGAPMPMEYIFGGVLVALIAFVVFQRRRSMTGKIRDLHAGGDKS